MINFIIGFILGAMLMMCAIGLVSLCKDKEPRSKVRFFITRDKHINSTSFNLWIGLPSLANSGEYFYSMDNKVKLLAHGTLIEKRYELNLRDFDDMRVGEIREVFINLED